LTGARIEFDVIGLIETAHDSCHQLNGHWNGEENILPFDGELYLIKQFYRQPESDLLFEQLEADLAWQEESIFIYGKWVKVPRLMCWYGDLDAYYRYSGVNHQPRPWTAALQAIREKVEQRCQ